MVFVFVLLLAVVVVGLLIRDHNNVGRIVVIFAVWLSLVVPVCVVPGRQSLLFDVICSGGLIVAWLMDELLARFLD